ncbi:hypothetical protein BJ165DRAFT_1474670 [Panaeolus papilionaceus]|nr:hypothetical protein BJ165DRAFT_1474670 [Panaeolus papilionaceus]
MVFSCCHICFLLIFITPSTPLVTLSRPLLFIIIHTINGTGTIVPYCIQPPFFLLVLLSHACLPSQHSTCIASLYSR